MGVLEQIKSKTNIDVDSMIIARLEKELNYTGNQLLYDIYEVLMIILDNTNLSKVPREMYSTVISMIKDYWYLNKHDMLNLSEEEKQQRQGQDMKVKSIVAGDTTTTFFDSQSQININGTTYNTGTIDFAKNILEEKYKEAFYRHRQPRWE